MSKKGHEKIISSLNNNFNTSEQHICLSMTANTNMFSHSGTSLQTRVPVFIKVRDVNDNAPEFAMYYETFVCENVKAGQVRERFIRIHFFSQIQFDICPQLPWIL